MPVTKKQNIIGPRLKELRLARKISLVNMAVRCARLDWIISEVGIVKIEMQIRSVRDAELLTLAEVLGVTPGDLLPAKPQVRSTIAKYFASRQS